MNLAQTILLSIALCFFAQKANANENTIVGDGYAIGFAIIMVGMAINHTLYWRAKP